MDYETEWQFDAPDLARLRGQLEARATLGGFELRRGPSRNLTDRYLDTPDARIALAGYALRIRCDGPQCEATLKALRSEIQGPQVRREINQPLQEPGIAELLAAEGAVSNRVRAVAGTQPLQPLLTVRTCRDTFRVMQGELDAAEITLDNTEFGDTDAATAVPMQRVEVELHAAAAASLEPLLAELQGPLGLVPARTSKLAAGLGTRSPLRPPAAVIEAPCLDPHAPAITVAQQALQALLAQWRDLEPAVRLGDDPEALHRLRVTGRRIAAVLRILDAARLGGARGLRRRLLALLRRFGPARDLDVQIAEFELVIHSSKSDLQDDALSTLIGPLRRARLRCQSSMLRELDATRTQHLFAALAALATRALPRRRPSSIATLAEPLLQRRYRQLRRRARAAISQGQAEQLHPLRLQAKKLRYIAEPLAGLYGAPMQRFLRRLQRLQTLLGQINDASHALTTLEHAARGRRRLPAGAVFALGRVAEQQQRRLDAARAALPKAWQRLRGRSWRRLRRAIRERAGEAPSAAPGPT